jgi:hypothetical protein
MAAYRLCALRIRDQLPFSDDHVEDLLEAPVTAPTEVVLTGHNSTLVHVLRAPDVCTLLRLPSIRMLRSKRE